MFIYIHICIVYCDVGRDNTTITCTPDPRHLSALHDRGTPFIKNTPLLGPYSRTLPRVLCWYYGGGLMLV